MRIAIVGTGISGLASAYLLSGAHQITLFESQSRIGGHTHTVTVQGDQSPVGVDTGFIVFNRDNYPLLTKLFERLGVASRPTTMSFSVRSEAYQTEFAGTSLNTLFADRRNLVRPWFLGMLRELLRFQRVGTRERTALPNDLSLAAWLEGHRFKDTLIDNYVVPLGASLWSAPREGLLNYSARFFLDFLANHRMLTLGHRPIWRTVVGGSSAYLEPLTRGFAKRIRSGDAVTALRRRPSGVELVTTSGYTDHYDHVIVACHADQALELIESPTDAEAELLSALPYRSHEVLLHTDTSILPARRSLWSSWNYLVPPSTDLPAAITYDMNILMGLKEPTTYCVTLDGHGLVHEDKILRRIRYAHPQATTGAQRARMRRKELIDHQGISYCGAYWGFGFHEDGLRSACEVAAPLGGLSL